MSEIRTYIDKTGSKGRTVTDNISKLSDGRIRHDMFSGTTLVASEILTQAEATALRDAYSAVLPPKLLWSDEFSGTALDPKKWQARSTTTPPNGELQAFRPANATVSGGLLNITAKKESYGGKAYTSARIDTKGLFEFTYGRVEARMKVPGGKGLWTAFWGLGNDDWEIGWPECGEFDVVEYINGDGHAVGSLHAPGYDKSLWTPSKPLHDDFHVYGLEWRKDGTFIWTLDGVEYARQVKGAPFDHPFYLILTLSVGGNWPGPPDATTPFPSSLLVDWVRVYA